MTGETGTGKSILLDALDALLGGLTSTGISRLIRSGSQKALIEAIFRVTSKDVVWLKSQGFDFDDNELLLSRELIRRNDRTTSRFRVNGVVVSKDQIFCIRPRLIDLTAQGQVQELSKAGQQRFCLDQLGGSSLEDTLKSVKAGFLSWKETSLALEDAEKDLQRSQKSFLQQKEFLEELELAQIEDPEEDIKLLQEQERLSHSVRLQEGVSIIADTLIEPKPEVPCVFDLLNLCFQEMNTMKQLDATLSSELENLIDIKSRLEDFSRTLESYGSVLQSEPQRLDELQERIADLKRLMRKTDSNLPELIQKRDSLRKDLMNDTPNTKFLRIKEEENKLRLSRDRFNEKLTCMRLAIAGNLQRTLMQYLNSLGLSNVRFEVQILPSQASEKGADSVQFLFSANPDQPLVPLIEIASGGEMSRFLLALKTTLASAAGSNTLVFDEIDSGVSGKVSTAIALLLKELSMKRQVLCVTHQPLVAAKADHHLRVSKSIHEGLTTVQVSYLDTPLAREIELAELAGGDVADTRAYVSSLLSKEAA